MMNSFQAGSSKWSEWIYSAVLGPNLWLSTFFPCSEDFDCGLWGEIFVEPFVVDLHHWCVDACSKTFNLWQSEEAICTCFIHADICVLFDSFHALSCSSYHARGGATELQMVLSKFCSIEHSIETGHLIYLHWFHLENLSNLVHSGQS